MPKPLQCTTANGSITADTEVNLHIGNLGIDVAPVILPSTPNVLSMGRVCIGAGFSHWWPGGERESYLIHPVTGESTPLKFG